MHLTPITSVSRWTEKTNVPHTEDWLRFILPSGNGGLFVYGLYADESYITKDGDFVVAGYLIGSKRLPEFIQRWSDALGPLEYFHLNSFLS